LARSPVAILREPNRPLPLALAKNPIAVLRLKINPLASAPVPHAVPSPDALAPSPVTVTVWQH
jgi:hypothetical protein